MYKVSPYIASGANDIKQHNDDVREKVASMKNPKLMDAKLNNNIKKELAKIIDNKEEFYELLNNKV